LDKEQDPGRKRTKGKERLGNVCNTAEAENTQISVLCLLMTYFLLLTKQFQMKPYS